MLSFLEYIIKYSICLDPHQEILYHTYCNTNNSITTLEFAVFLKQDNKFIACNIQINFLSHNPTYYKYNTCKFKICRYDFSHLILLELQINCNKIIQLYQDNV